MLHCLGVPVYLVPVPLPHCMWVPVPVSVVPVPLPLQLLLFTVALPGASRQRLPSTAMIYICSLDTNPYKNVHGTRKTCTSTKTRETIRHLFLHNESKTRAGGIKILYKCCTFMYSTHPSTYNLLVPSKI